MDSTRSQKHMINATEAEESAPKCIVWDSMWDPSTHTVGHDFSEGTFETFNATDWGMMVSDKLAGHTSQSIKIRNPMECQSLAILRKTQGPTQCIMDHLTAPWRPQIQLARACELQSVIIDSLHFEHHMTVTAKVYSQNFSFDSLLFYKKMEQIFPIGLR